MANHAFRHAIYDLLHILYSYLLADSCWFNVGIRELFSGLETRLIIVSLSHTTCVCLSPHGCLSRLVTEVMSYS